MTEESVFAEALSLAPEARPEFLAQACAGRAQLRARVEALLAAHAKPHNMLDKRPADLAQMVDSPPVGSDHSAPPERAADLPNVPGYRVLREIARGGMGRKMGKMVGKMERKMAKMVTLYVSQNIRIGCVGIFILRRKSLRNNILRCQVKMPT